VAVKGNYTIDADILVVPKIAMVPLKQSLVHGVYWSMQNFMEWICIVPESCHNKIPFNANTSIFSVPSYKEVQ
jgi:hypothetical protein